MTDDIDQLLSQVPDGYTCTRRSRKDGRPWIIIRANQRDPDTGDRERFEVEGPADLVQEAVAFWIGLRSEKTNDD